MITPGEFSGWLGDRNRRPLVMGVLNVTPDSFSDGGRYAETAAAVDHALAMIDAGVDLIDVGGESTRPGASPVEVDEQLRRIFPVISQIRRQSQIVMSVDTTQGAVAEKALDAGGTLINDISAGQDDPAMFPLAARRGCPIVLMHIQGRPATMQVAPHYEDVMAEVSGSLNDRLIAAGIAGIDVGRILLDPGIGFGKTVEHNLSLLRRLRELTVLGRPLVVGTSRKGFLGKVTGESDPHRPLGTNATVAWAVANGAGIVRVHDIKPAVAVVKMIHAILEAD